jgi:conserved oligomeric Golgi complex subunit 8
MFEVATQYNAIFRAQTNAHEGSTSLLSMWTSRRVHSFLTMVAGQLQRMEDSAALRDALEASVFFSTSMGRLGADFTAQLPALFEPRMLALVEQAWKDGPQQLEETLKICRDAGVAAPLVSLNVPPEAAGAPATEGQPMAPPRSLMALPPLARVVNAVLTGLNDLRRCLLPGIFSQLRASLQEIIVEVRSILSANEKAVNMATLRGEKKELREAASRMRVMFRDIVEPYLRGSLEMALGDFAAAEVQYDVLRKKEEEEKRQAEEAEKASLEVEKAAEQEGEEAENDAIAEPGIEEEAQQPTVDESAPEESGDSAGVEAKYD